jgi:hypothetical protein
LGRRAFIGGLLAAPVVAACGGGDDEEAGPSTPSTTVPGVPPPPPHTGFPLTGLPIDDGARAARPAVVVKVSNADGSRAGFQARPQAGINAADVVVEELTEGSVTRLACVFHSIDADPVGPVRSFRTTDLDLVAALGRPLLSYSGANGPFLERLRAADRVVDLGFEVAGGAYRRTGDRAAPENLLTSTVALYAAAAGQGIPPPPWFPYRADPAAAPGTGARPAAGVGIVFGDGPGSAPVDYAWDPALGGWARSQKGTPYLDEAGALVAPPNVVVQFVDYRDTGITDSSGASVPEAILVGEGTAWVLTAGQVVEGRWVKPDPFVPTAFLAPDGTGIGFTRGRTWLALAPPGSGALR